MKLYTVLEFELFHGVIITCCIQDVELTENMNDPSLFFPKRVIVTGSYGPVLRGA